MRELEAIIATYQELKIARTQCVLATVVHVKGSSYRRAGARMLIDEFGNITGAISGGCLEGDALRKALHALHQQKNKLVTYDTSDDDDAAFGAQLGCNGIIQVLFEPLDFSETLNPCELLKIVHDREQALAIIIQFNFEKSEPQHGTRMLVDKNAKMTGQGIDPGFQDLILAEASIVLSQNKPQFSEFDSNGEQAYFFIQNYQPPVKLVIVGAGNDAQILARQAELLGWKVIITDGRPTHANENRFSGCQVIVTKPEKTLENIEIDDRTCFVMMSHNYHYDLSVLELLLDRDELPYIGILGPKKKFDLMLSDLTAKNVLVNKHFMEKIHAPVGLEIGSETPAEIGLSILAEIQAVLTGKSGKPLREKKSPIHEHVESQFKKIEA